MNMNKFKIISLFSGIGAFEKALDRLNVDYEVVNYCEVDKYAAKAYSLIHNVPESKNLGDISKVDFDSLPKDIDLVTYGFPCQDISSAGLQKGFFDSEGNLTRSGLFFEALKVIKSTNTKFAIAENVKALTSKTFEKEFETVLSSLDALGYNNYYKVLNAKDYGIPQNRERVFIISIRKDIDNGRFTFPKKLSLPNRLRDILDESTPESYYVEDLKKFTIDDPIIKEEPKWGFNFSWIKKTVKNVGCSLVGGFNGKTWGDTYHNGDRCYDSNYLSVCLTTTSTASVKYVVPTTNTKAKGLLERLPNGTFKFVKEVKPGMDLYRVRKLTPKESFRLIGFSDEDYQILADNGFSKAQIYKRAGNSIVVDVLYYLMKDLLKTIK